jgi:hypothetical protein
MALQRLFCTVALLLALAAGAQAADALPFQVGEKITYQLKWGLIPAGTVVLEVLPLTTMAGQPARHFRMTTRSSGFIDTFYKVRGVVEGYTDLALHHSLHYEKRQREGSSNRHVTVAFDGTGLTAQYHNRLKQGPRAAIAVAEGTFDPFSVVYFCRLFDFAKLTVLERPISDGKKMAMGRVDNRGQQTIMINDTAFDTFLIEPDIKDVGGVFQKSTDATILIWLSADDRRLPVKLQSKVIVGSFTAEMISYQAK